MHPLARKHTCAEARVSTQHAEQHTRQGGAPSGLSSPLMYGGRLLQRCTAGTAECTIARPSSASHGVDLCSYIVAGAVAVLAASYASVPLYRLYCQSTGKMRLLPLFYPSQPRQGTRRAYSHILLGAVRVPTMPSASLLRGCLLGLSSSGSQCDLRCLACRTVPLRRRFGRPRDCDDA